ncbi:MAG: hypothetical protein H6830_08645 [Planctomycetes bacterium]|nr:hypothetical protein [Planctomycetota bacterium]MCB9909657.1 hypothetical protein [Planctomycetota bacterium]MCB9911854.1 hypothetical protein [Planctomycetota bacterium]HRV80423.1 hypothetical protein [Planctomycetota bacterium]
MSGFSTQDSHSGRWHQPVSVPIHSGDAFQAACELVEDLGGWTDIQVDPKAMVLTCKGPGGLLGKPASIRIWTEGREGMPASTTHCSSEGGGGLLSKDKANVTEFIRKFYMRVT